MGRKSSAKKTPLMGGTRPKKMRDFASIDDLSAYIRESYVTTRVIEVESRCVAFRQVDQNVCWVLRGDHRGPVRYHRRIICYQIRFTERTNWSFIETAEGEDD